MLVVYFPSSEIILEKRVIFLEKSWSFFMEIVWPPWYWASSWWLTGKCFFIWGKLMSSNYILLYCTLVIKKKFISGFSMLSYTLKFHLDASYHDQFKVACMVDIKLFFYLKTLTSSNYPTVQYFFAETLHMFPTYQCLQKGVWDFFDLFRSWVIN